MSPALAGGFLLPLSHPGKPLEFLTLKYVCSEQFINYSLGFPTSGWFSQQFLPIDFCSDKLQSSVSACLSHLRNRNLPCDLSSLPGLRRVVIFSLFSFFLVWMEEVTSKLLAGNSGASVHIYSLSIYSVLLWTSLSVHKSRKNCTMNSCVLISFNFYILQFLFHLFHLSNFFFPLTKVVCFLWPTISLLKICFRDILWVSW